MQPVFDSLPKDIPEGERESIIDFIKSYQDVFSRSDYDIGRTTLIEHSIETGQAAPFRQPLRRHPQVYLQTIDEETENMRKSGIIEPACSPWASNVVVVTKQDKTPRITLDYRQLNQVTRKDSYPLPNIADCLDAFEGASFFCALDLRSSFYQVPLAEADRDKTAFITRRGQWRFKSLPMGLCNSPGTFQRLMDLVLRGLTWSSVLVYIDDIVVYAHTAAELRKRLEEVFQRLRSANLKLKPSKVKLFQREIKFLGHKISAEGIAMDESKIAEIVNWPTPRNLLDVKKFLGMAGYYRRYIKDYAELARPLNDLNKKDEPFIWTYDRKGAFEYLKQRLASAPILAMSKDDGKFILDVDASEFAVGAVLQQEQDGLLRVIGYSSKSFNTHEKNYCITRKELAAIIFGLSQYRQYLLGRAFAIRTDHAALTYLLTAKTPIGQQARWLDFMSEFNFEIIHRAGISHINADSLSRKSPCDAGGIYCKQCHRGEKEAEEDVEGNTVGLCAVVTTRAQKREAEAPQEPDVVVTDSPVQPVQQETTTSDPDTRPPPRKRGRPRKTAAPAIDQTVGEEPENPEMTTERTETGPATSQSEPRSPTKGGRRRKVLDNRIRRAMEPWTDSFLREKQVEDRNIKTVLEWIEAGARPDFNTVRAFSPSVKGYWQQYSSLYTENGVLYRRVEPAVDGQQAARQLILPRALRQEFLDLVHRGIGGHLGSFKTRAHVGRRAYWYMWRRDVDMYCKRCITCNE